MITITIQLDHLFYIIAGIAFVIYLGTRFHADGCPSSLNRTIYLVCDITSLIIYVVILLLKVSNVAGNVAWKMYLPGVLLVVWIAMTVSDAIKLGRKKKEDEYRRR